MRKIKSFILVGAFALIGIYVEGAGAAPVSPSTCAQMAGTSFTQWNASQCQQLATNIQNCINSNLLGQAFSSASSPSAQFQAISQAAGALAQIDYQCQYYLSGGQSFQ